MAQIARLTLGTIEQVPIKITDELEHLTTFTGADLRYSLYSLDDDGIETAVITNAACGNEDLIALPLINTTVGSFAKGYYNIYITFVASPETLKKGPYKILVD